VSSTILDVEAIATDAQVYEAGGGESLVTRARPKDSPTLSAQKSRALADVLKVLAQRRPPVFDTSLVDPTELRDAVVYRTLSNVFGDAITAEGDAWHVRHKRFAQEYANALSSLSPTVTDGVVAASGLLSIPISRR
jgi:hypothetical protein